MGTGPPIVLDCDPGHDDAIALVLAAAELLGLDAVVRAGADRPLLRRAPPRLPCSR